MLVNFLISIIICSDLLIADGQQMLGAGKWTVLNTQQCANDEEMPWRTRIRRHKLNRTHDAFDADVDLGEDLDDSFAIRLEICKMVDGGCKPYMIMNDDCLPNFVKKYAGENVKSILASAGIDPPDFPVNKGQFHIENYVINMEDLVKYEGVYGEYGVDAFISKDGQDMLCTRINCKYEVSDDDRSSVPYG